MLKSKNKKNKYHSNIIQKESKSVYVDIRLSSKQRKSPETERDII